MRVYRVNFFTPHEGTVVRWFATKTEAEKQAKTNFEEHNASIPGSVEPTDIPTDKAGLLKWLNANLILDNG